MRLLDELKRRNVYKVAAVYAAVAWVLLQFVSLVIEPLGVPIWTFKLLLVLVAIGFPIAVVLAWATELTPETLKPDQPAAGDGPPRSPLRIVEFVLVLAVCVTVGYLYLDTLREPVAVVEVPEGLAPGPATSSAGQPPAPDAVATKPGNPLLAPRQWKNSVAVLPFNNMSSDAENEYFSDGISEELLNVLARMEGLKVPARTSSFFFKGKNEDIRKIGAMLGVEHVLEGSVRKAGNQVRITAQLISVADGAHLWSETYDRDLSDIFAVQDEIARAIAKQLQVELGLAAKGSSALRGTSNVEAYDYLLRAEVEMSRATLDASERALASLDKAIAADPNFAAAYGRRGVILTMRSINDADSSTFAAIDTAFNKALELDPNNLPARLYQINREHQKNWDWRQLEQDYVRLIQSEGEHPDVLYPMVGHVYLPLGRVAEAAAAYRKAQELNPFSSEVNLLGMGLAVISKNWPAVLKITQSGGIARSATGLATQCMVYDQLGDKAGVMRSMQQLRAMENVSEQQVLGCQVRAHLWNNDPTAARRAFMHRADILPPRGYGVVMANLALRMGDVEVAMDWFDKAFTEGEERIKTLRSEHNDNAELRANPRYQSLLRKMRLDDESLREMGYL